MAAGATSGWPKNQKRCWNSIGSPPPATSKNEVLKLRSVRIIVIPPASTGNDNNNNTAVITTAQPNKANFSANTNPIPYSVRGKKKKK